MEGAFHRICSLLSHCKKHGLVFSPHKFQFARKEVEFVGFLITEQGVKQAVFFPGDTGTLSTGNTDFMIPNILLISCNKYNSF